MDIEKLGNLISKEEEIELLKKLPQDHRPLWLYWAEFVKDYIQLEERSEVTIKACLSVFRVLLRESELVSIEQFNSPRLVKHALAELKEKRRWSPVTYNSYIKSINTYYRWLEAEELVSERKTTKIRKLAEREVEQYVFSPKDLEKVIAYVLGKYNPNRLVRWRNIVLIQLLIVVGMRKGEVLNLKLRDLDIDKNRCIITVYATKNRYRPRRYHLKGEVLQNLEVYLSFRSTFREEQNIDYLFVSGSKIDKPFTKSGLQKFLKKIERETGVMVTTHAFRRYAVTFLHLSGKPYEQIADFMGHQRVSTTKKYMARLPQVNDDCIEEMHKIFFRPNT